MKDDRIPTRYEEKNQLCCRKRGRSQQRWQDCLKRALRMADEDEKWRAKPGSNGKITKVTVQRVTSDPPHGHKRETIGRTMFPPGQRPLTTSVYRSWNSRWYHCFFPSPDSHRDCMSSHRCSVTVLPSSNYLTRFNNI